MRVFYKQFRQLVTDGGSQVMYERACRFASKVLVTSITETQYDGYLQVTVWYSALSSISED